MIDLKKIFNKIIYFKFKFKMGNQNRILKENYKNNNQTNTEGTQGLMTINKEKNLKKNAAEIIYKENNRNENNYTKRESVDILLNKNNLNTMPTENNDILKQTNQNNLIIGNNVINYKFNKIFEDNNSIAPNEKEYKISQNNSNHKNRINELNSKNEEKSKNIKKNEFNNITIIDNLNNYFPKNISKEEIDDLVNIALKGYIVDDISEYIPGKNINIEQANLIKQIIYDNIKKNKKNNNDDNSILAKINVKIWMSELNKEVIEKMFFKGKQISQIQSDIIIKNLTKGKKNVKALAIELL